MIFSLIMNLCAVSIATIKTSYENMHLINGDNQTSSDKEKLYAMNNEKSETQQPYVKAKVNGYGRNFLYDTGASRTCIKLEMH